ncbi:MAG: prolyl aminopeptidase [Alphaproteobacteria bacterium]|nr:prolyl aminopeptidase [Alphaproteobacteria bacterium]
MTYHRKAVQLRSFYPKIEPYDHGMLDVGEGHKIYWEVCGNPQGRPALFLHGGPGGGCGKDHRRLFNPKKYRIVLFDQRGCGRSVPYNNLKANTTQHLISDIEKLRHFLKIEDWVILGGSWGSALALAYAEKYPKRVSGLVLRGIFTLRKKELEWFYKGGASFLFPEAWERFTNALSPTERKNIMGSYQKRLSSKNKKIKIVAARAWSDWEGDTLCLIPKGEYKIDESRDRFALAIASIENHYFVNNGFVKEGQLIRNASKLADIPGVIIQGRYDMVCPPVTAWELHKNWPSSKLVIVPDAGHAYDEPGILDATIRATDDFAKWHERKI